MEPPEAAVGVLRHVLRLREPQGVLLQLTCLPLPDRLEAGGRLLGYLDQAAFLRDLLVTERAVELLVDEGLLVEEERLEHDVLVHFSSGPEAVEHLAANPRSELGAELQAGLEKIDGPVVQRASCLWRRLRVLPG